MTKRRKSNHHRKPQQKAKLVPGECRHTIVAGKGGKYVRVQVEYMTYSEELPGLAKAIRDAMYSAARTTDLRSMAATHRDEIVEGEILTPDGTFVVQAWLPAEGELLILKGRPATVEDIATLDRYAEDPSETEPRKAEARRILAEQQAAAEAASQPSVLAAAAEA